MSRREFKGRGDDFLFDLKKRKRRISLVVSVALAVIELPSRPNVEATRETPRERDLSKILEAKSHSKRVKNHPK